MPSLLKKTVAGLVASFAMSVVVTAPAAAQASARAPQVAPAPGAPAAQAPADPQFEAAKNFVSFYTFNRLAYKQVCDKQAVDVSVFVNTFVNENAPLYAKALSVLQAHGMSETAVMAKLQGTIASSESDVRQALQDSAARENVGTTPLDGCRFLATHGEKLAGDLDLAKSHPEVIQTLNGPVKP
jgi:predicted nucleotidyltransferase